jgi:hypothetical protein
MIVHCCGLQAGTVDAGGEAIDRIHSAMTIKEIKL